MCTVLAKLRGSEVASQQDFADTQGPCKGLALYGRKNMAVADDMCILLSRGPEGRSPGYSPHPWCSAEAAQRDSSQQAMVSRQ